VTVGIQETLLVCWLTASPSLLIPLHLVECVLYYVLFVCITACQAVMDMLFMFSRSVVSRLLNDDSSPSIR
jgi:hypothetical protein